MKTLKQTTLVLIGVIAGLFISLLASKIIISITNLYEIPFLKGITLLQMFGFVGIVKILLYKRTEEVAPEEISEFLTKSLWQLFGKTVFLLGIWGLYHLSFYALS